MTIFRQLFDKSSSTYTYIIGDESSGEAVIIDPVAECLDRDIQLLKELRLSLKYSLDTHVHADHITASGLLREQLGCRSGVHAEAGVTCVDIGLKDNDSLEIGAIKITAMSTPGHTSGCMSYYIKALNMVFTGDALLIRGCGRTDFQQGDTKHLFESIRNKLFILPDDTLVYPGHDYKGLTQSSIKEEKAYNPRVKLTNSFDEFKSIMDNLKLSDPKLMDIAIPANLGCGIKKDPLDKTEVFDNLYEEITIEEFINNRDSLDNAANSAVQFSLIDVREPEEFTGTLGHIPGSVLIPLGDLEFALDSLNKDDDYLMICRSGNRSGKASALMVEEGFQSVTNLLGGMLAYNKMQDK